MQHIKIYHYDNDDMIDDEIYINAASCSAIITTYDKRHNASKLKLSH